ncbi:acetyl-CoA acetyltransferase [bacterium]|nr:acetyl-CoA acetyltransferase [bacterium]
MNQDYKTSRPVIIGVGQHVNRSRQTDEPKEVDELIASAVRKAEEDAQCRDLAKKVDTLLLVNSFSMTGDDPYSKLNHSLGIKPDHMAYTWIGACAPQWYVNQMKERLASGQSRLGLICGGEALYSKKLKSTKSSGQSWDQSFPEKRPWMAGDLRDPLTSLEMKYGLMLPIHIYPLFENSLRAKEGLSLQDHYLELGEFCASLSRKATGNPYAWFESKTAGEILDVSGKNRIVSWPYTKYMCSIMDVDQSAALFMTDEAYAKELGIPRDKWIYLLGSGDASDTWHVTERERFYASPSVGVAADAAMIEAGIGIEDIDHFDLYSCFPAAARTTRNMLALPKDDPRAMTVTGGMPTFGGPGNNYSLHAICSMVEVLRQNPKDQGMVQALSWFISKHSVGIYASEFRSSGKGTMTLNGYHWTLVYNKTSGVSFYINGNLVDTNSQTGGIDAQTLPNKIGNNYTNQYYHTGELDDFRIYNRAISVSEIQALYNE